MGTIELQILNIPADQGNSRRYSSLMISENREVSPTFRGMSGSSGMLLSRESGWAYPAQ